MNARDLPCRVSLDLARFMQSQDEAAKRGQRMQFWRLKRQSELEGGGDVDALVNSVDPDDLADKLTQFVAAALLLDPNLRALKLRELTDRMVKRTLALEESRWVDE